MALHWAHQQECRHLFTPNSLHGVTPFSLFSSLSSFLLTVVPAHHSNLRAWIKQSGASKGGPSSHRPRNRQLSDFFVSDEPSEHLKRLLGLSIDNQDGNEADFGDDNYVSRRQESVHEMDRFALKEAPKMSPIEGWLNFKFDLRPVYESLST